MIRLPPKLTRTSHPFPYTTLFLTIGQHGFARDGLDQTSSADGPENLRKNRHDREGADVGPREQACQKDKDDEGEELVRHETHDRPADRMLALPPQICVKSCAK